MCFQLENIDSKGKTRNMSETQNKILFTIDVFANV